MPPRKDHTRTRRACLGSMIREKRIERGLTQFDLGQMVQLRSDEVCAVENGRKPISPRKVMQISQALDIDSVVLKTAWRIDRKRGEVVGGDVSG